MSLVKSAFKTEIFEIDFTPDKYVIAYSGGVDSQVLLHLAANSLDAPVIAVHCHHGVSENSDLWAQHCKAQASKLNVTCFVEHLNLGNTASNFEAVAREKRYEALKSHMSDKSVLLTGHHMDDQAETMLMRLLRGSGIDGLSCIASRSKQDGLTICRPLLGVRKADLKRYADANELEWVEDESNDSCDFDRNFIRNEVLPLVKTRWPDAVSSIAQSVEHCSNARDELHELTDNDLDYVRSSIKADALELDKLKQLSKFRRTSLYRKWLEKLYGKLPGKSELEFIDKVFVETEDAVTQYKSHEYVIYLYRGMLCFSHQGKTKQFYLEEFSLRQHKADKPKLVNVPSACECNWRERKEGDKMRFRGKTKSLKKVFQEAGIPSWERSQYKVLELNGDIVAIGDIISSDYLDFEGFRIKVKE
ncbi:tRNA lysidine(34) synthetase TilS [Vibrio owensii]|uniref:tRNA lysidine(34) synthetase TilS n=1 Tax=Vibrio owensii TaxID=696485 RepID=UPI003CC5A2EB